MDGASVPLNDMNSLRTYARELASNDYAVAQTLLSLVPAAKAHVEEVGSCNSDLARDLLGEANEILSDLRRALSPDGKVGSRGTTLWGHAARFPDPYKGKAWAPDQDALEDVVARYLVRPWMSSGYLDWVMVDALTRREIIAYEAAVAIALPAPGTLSWAITNALTSWTSLIVDAVLAGLAAWWLWSEFSTEAPYRLWWAAGIGAFYGWWLLSLPFRVRAWVRGKRARRKELLATAERLKSMRDCYAELGAPVLDPTRVRDALLAAEKLEVRWSRTTWPLLEAVIAKHPHCWTKR